jgi:hypothetical protein
MNKHIAQLIHLSVLLLGLFVVEKARADEAEVLEVMEACNAKAKYKLNARQIAAAAMSRFPDNAKARMYWYILLCMESGFNPKAGPSPAGAIGIGQIMPQYAKEFAAYCQMAAPSPSELSRLDINLAVSSCRWSELFVMFSGDVALGLASYNAGPNSKDIERIKQNGTRSINRETMGYLALAFSLQEKIERIKDDKKLHSDTDIGNYFPGQRERS